MLSSTELDKVTDSIRSASTSTEARFLDIGGRLGTAVETIATLTQTFDFLANELKGENLRTAVQELSQMMSAITALAHLHADERRAFGQLGEQTARIQQRVVQIGKAVTGIGILALNARIEAVNIGIAGLDFAGFTTEIGQTLLLAQGSLDQFTGELRGVGNQLRLAAASQVAFAQQQAAAIRSVPARLATSIGTITDRGTRAAAAAFAVAHKSREVGQSISNAVMALQIGDSTRQRLEHVEYALSIVTEIVSSPSDGGPASRGGWSGLTDPQRHTLVDLCNRLLAAQLLDAADDFDHEVQKILSSVQELEADAHEILRLGNEAAGASGDRRGTFLGAVEEQVVEVGRLLDGLRIARRGADEVAMSVSEATTRLVNHTGTLRSLEEDIRFMGLNTSLRCGRLGVIGRPLMVIAQELRIYANQIATEVNAVAANLDNVSLTAGSLSGGREESAAAIAAVATIMADSVTRLGVAGESLADALATLDRDTGDVAALLRNTVARAIVHEELGTVLRQAATDLASGTTEIDGTEMSTPEAVRVMELFVRLYTMDKERVVHDRYYKRRSSSMTPVVTTPAPHQAAPAEFEDVFF